MRTFLQNPMGPILWIALAALFPITANAQSNDTSNPIIARTAALVEAYNAQDLDAIGAIYAEDAIVLAPNQASILGREAIVAFYANAYAAGMRNMQFMTFDIRPTDAMAVEIGETVVESGSASVVSRYMHLWEVIDGQLLLTRDMFHVVATR